jgi:hypothetical protein
VAVGAERDPLARLAARHASSDNFLAAVRASAGSDSAAFLNAQIKLTLAGADRITTLPSGAEPSLAWTAKTGGGSTFFAAGAGALVAVGHATNGPAIATSGITVTAPAFVALTMTALDGKALPASGAILIAACGRAENVGMGFSADRRTVGRNWGKGPAGIEPVAGEVPLPPGNWQCHALKPDGTPSHVLELSRGADGTQALLLSQSHGTMWYLLAPAR